RAGLRKLLQSTSVPSSTLLVVAASAESSDQHSQTPMVGAFSEATSRWSTSQMESKPSSSARCDIASRSLQRAVSPSMRYSPSGRMIPTFGMPALALIDVVLEVLLGGSQLAAQDRQAL